MKGMRHDPAAPVRLDDADHRPFHPRRRLHPLTLLLEVALALTPVGLLAGGAAWGEWEVAEFQRMVGFVPAGIRTAAHLPAPLADYTAPGVGPVAGYLLSATLGVALVFGVLRLVRRRG
ncbi:MAG: hypothetical protein GW783_05220 [Deltaproteobacteria bacterium]|nr:hypothetical protein [Deltaproteobacteria bacterium]NCS73510.1 hypothetical protein [Deltaproteobacteria bacterium]